jgi:periplasmic protein TonB
MFNNLIESSSHKTELKRRGSYFLFTTATYLVLFAVAGVLSIYAYDARLEEPASEIVMISPLDYQPPAPAEHQPAPSQPSSGSNKPLRPVRQIAMASVNQPQVAPQTISAKPNTNLPVPAHGDYDLGDHDADPVGVAGSGKPNGTGGGNTLGGNGTLAVDVGVPPVPPVKKPVPRIVSKGVITGDAVSLPKPAYPPMAKQMRIQGAVSVQVLIDESGKVVSARAVSGSPALVHAAQQAALNARFSPTKLGDQPVKVSGVITYNFILQ